MPVENNFHSKSIKSTERELQTSIKNGLSSHAIKSLQAKYGKNEISKGKQTSAFVLLLKQIANPLNYLLFIVITISILTNHLFDAYIITILITINTVIGFYLEYSAQKKSESIKKLINKNTLSIRNATEQIIDTKELVPGDIIILTEGDAVPADARIVEEFNLMVNESTLTGESLPIKKQTQKVAHDTVLAERVCMLHAGTSIASGRGKAIVVKTGDNTELGNISQTLEEIKHERSLFHERTERLTRTMIAFSAVTAIAAFVILVIRGVGYFEIFEFTVAALVSGIPEGLPSVLTVLLSVASVRMAKRKALLKSTPAIETLSSVDVIVTDKTGTITQNKISVSELLWQEKTLTINSGSYKTPLGLENEVLRNTEFQKLLEFLSIASECEIIKSADRFQESGSPTELARYAVAYRAGFSRSEVSAKLRVLDMAPYDQNTKYSKYLVEVTQSGQRLLIVVGGSDKVLKLTIDPKEAIKYANKMGKLGYRMQTISYKKVECDRIGDCKTKNLNHLATLSMSDPIRNNVADTIAKTQEAGIRVIMATGDSKETAFAIARQAGIIDRNAENIEKYVVDQSQIDQMSDKEFRSKLQVCNVFARVTPKTKLKIAEELIRLGSVVAMTGDGVNDGPALKKADIGIAMGLNGTDVARDSSDLILLDNSFDTIYSAIREGRTVFANIKRSSAYLVITNLAEDSMIIFALLLGFPLPLLPIQILWLNLVTDGLNDVALAIEPSDSSIMKSPPLRSSANILGKKDIFPMILSSLVMALVSIAFFVVYKDKGDDYARTMVFVIMVLFQVLNAYNLRSEKSIFRINPFTNKALLLSMALSILLLILTLYWSPLSSMLSTNSIPATDLLITFALSILIIITSELYKLVNHSTKKVKKVK